MTAVLYIHGFLSSPKSHKARVTEQWLKKHYPHVKFFCPALSSYPSIAKSTLDQLADRLKDDTVFVIGSSLGGFWATYLIENRKAEKAVLINPAVSPQSRFTELIGVPLQSYYTNDVFRLAEKDLHDLERFDHKKISQPLRYWLMVQTGDETLDYRLAVERYSKCKQLVEEGGSHTFDGFEKWLPKVAAFFKL